jgi:hypothetical protein
MANTPKMLGITDEVTDCGCCGKSGLKRTVEISLDGESDPVYFGTDCAARALQGRGYTVKPAKILRTAEAVKFARECVVRAHSSIAQIEALIAAGHVRYPIGGKEIGALLSECLASAKWNVERTVSDLAKRENGLVTA